MMLHYGSYWSLRFDCHRWFIIRSISQESAISELIQLRKEDIPRTCVAFKFSRSSGPGGQNVNKVNTKAELRLTLTSSETTSWLPENIRQILQKTFANRINQDHQLRLTCDSHRSQRQNQDACLEKLVHLIRDAANLVKGFEGPSMETRQRVQRL
jgi:peptidyl-tRNA hydrolase ICT1